jgi:DNA repair protein RadD
VSAIIPRYYQYDAFEAFKEYTAEKWGSNPLVVLPTGTGKAYVQAMIVQWMLEWPNTKILLLTHDQNLIQQNYDEFTNLMNGQLIDAGIYCAGLKRKEYKNRITFASIQSVHKKAWTAIGFRDLILIDEAHLVPHKDEGMYRTFLTEMRKINKNIVIGGLSATPYRMKGGLLTKGKTKIFDDVCYEATIPELINPNHPKNRDKKQYLCNVITPKKAMKSKVDLSGVHVRAGEYALDEMEIAFNKDDLVERSVKEIIEYSVERKHVLIFSVSIDHCEKIYEAFQKFGQTCDYVHSKRTDIENQKALSDFRIGKIKYLINVDKLTTGFNQKNIDCIAILRSTKSTGLYVQIVGRGTRIDPSKEDCLILDFGNNIITHGPIDKIEIREGKDGNTEIGTMPEKMCPQCESMLFLAVMICPDCGYEFPRKDSHEDQASEADIISKWKKPETYDVSYIEYSVHSKTGSPDCLRVKYYVGDLTHYDEYVCPLHQGFAAKKAKRWLDQRLPVERLDEPLYSIEDIIKNKNKIDKPVQIIVDLNGRFPQITGFLFSKIEQEQENVNVREKATV